YKQIKFVFDKQQYQILKDMKKNHYPVPLPEKLYIELLTESQLEYFFDGTNIAEVMEKNCFGEKLKKMQGIITKSLVIDPDGSVSKGERSYLSEPLQYLFCRSCLWGMLRSIARRMEVEHRQILWKRLSQWIEKGEPQERGFCEVSNKIWEISEQIIDRNSLYSASDWKDFIYMCRPCYNSFFEYIESERMIADWIKIEGSIDRLFTRTKVRMFVSTTKNPDWFIDFFTKYRCTANPDYFLNFHWELSSGEKNLLSTFASFYYIFGSDYTNERNGNYTIYNEWEKAEYVKCDNIILLADEADLTYHPEWQREFISLLTAFLVRVYPPTCCKNIQIILSTHSPVLLGDVPQQNVVYLRKDENEHGTKVDDSVQLETFGQNILLLLQHSFFLENGTMGKFAYNKINSIFEELSKLEDNVDKALKNGDNEKRDNQFVNILGMYRQYVDLIGERIIRQKLISKIQHINDKLYKKEAIQYLSDELLEERMQLLQAEKNRRKFVKESNN
ncbi:MAG: AAA family ATPase, partial [Lachnospiraceae bacterium]|nr:AAA family ATPase [Lachnospiraceae bacterium]